MPDWSYHPLFKPFLFRMPPDKARDLTLSAMARLGNLPYGPQIIDMMGHMDAPLALSQSLFGKTISGPVGLGAGLNLPVEALPALSRFGFGYIELGPITLSPVKGDEGLVRRADRLEILFSGLPVNGGAEALIQKLRNLPKIGTKLAVRLTHAPETSLTTACDEVARLVCDFSSLTTFLTIDPGPIRGDSAGLKTYYEAAAKARAASSGGASLMLCIAPDTDISAAISDAKCALEAGFSGLIVTGGCQAEGHRLVGLTTRSCGLNLVRALRGHFGPDTPIIGSGGIITPHDALAMLEAGADLIQIHSGFVYSGPGLPKRINEAALYQKQALNAPVENSSDRKLATGWRGLLLLGLGMLGSGVLALIIAMTRVLLPYDERFVGMSRDQLMTLNCCLLHFMAHDRVTLAGTMISLGVLYSFLAYNGVRSGAHWAWKAAAVSGAVGFSSFFLFLGYGYFDPLHALAAAGLFPFYLTGMRASPRGIGRISDPGLENDKAWKMSVLGQMIFVFLGFGLCLGGISIAIVGVTCVLIPTDLAYLKTTHELLVQANPRLIPLIAHDRAGFGGALFSDGVCVLLSSLWGFRRGERWVWWMLLLSGLPGFLCGTFVHFHIGYTTFSHLLPLYIAIALFTIALWLCKPFLWSKPKAALTP